MEYDSNSYTNLAYIWYGIEIDFYEKKSKMNFRWKKKVSPAKMVYMMHARLYLGISYKCGGGCPSTECTAEEEERKATKQ